MELREEVRPAGPYRLPRRTGMDGVMRRRGGVLERLLHDEHEPVVVRVVQTSPETVLFGARARTAGAARHGIERMRFALGVDDDLRPFLRRFADDPLIGRSVRMRPWLRVGRRPEPFEALVWAVCEQLIEYERAAAIQRRLVARLGRRWTGTEDAREAGAGEDAREAGAGEDGAGEDARKAGAGEEEKVEGEAWASGLRDLPTAAKLGATAPAVFESCDLAASRAIALRRAAEEVARGRVDLHDPEHERGWSRLRAIRGIGAWTVETMALRGQGRYDQLPAGDLGLLKLVGRRLGGGEGARGLHPRAEEHEVRAFFAGYGEWAGLAAVHAAGL
ncbi:MAG: DNA-3-methyladenine glycosylase family protein [Solirubrobacteraceae bacterium]